MIVLYALLVQETKESDVEIYDTYSSIGEAIQNKRRIISEYGWKAWVKGFTIDN